MNITEALNIYHQSIREASIMQNKRFYDQADLDHWKALKPPRTPLIFDNLTVALAVTIWSYVLYLLIT